MGIDRHKLATSQTCLCLFRSKFDCFASVACFFPSPDGLLTIDLSPTHKPVAVRTRRLTGSEAPTNQKPACLLCTHLAGTDTGGENASDETKKKNGTKSGSEPLCLLQQRKTDSGPCGHQLASVMEG